MGDTVPFSHREMRLMLARCTRGYMKARIMPTVCLAQLFDHSFLFSMLKKYYKRITLRMANLTFDGAHLTPRWKTVMFSSCSPAVAVSTDIF